MQTWYCKEFNGALDGQPFWSFTVLTKNRRQWTNQTAELREGNRNQSLSSAERWMSWNRIPHKPGQGSVTQGLCVHLVTEIRLIFNKKNWSYTQIKFYLLVNHYSNLVSSPHRQPPPGLIRRHLLGDAKRCRRFSRQRVSQNLLMLFTGSLFVTHLCVWRSASFKVCSPVQGLSTPANEPWAGTKNVNNQSNGSSCLRVAVQSYSSFLWFINHNYDQNCQCV